MIDFVTRQRRARRRSSTCWPKAAASASAASASPAAARSPASACWRRASRFDTDGLVREQRLPQRRPAAQRHRARFGRQRLSLHGYFDSNEVGQPGAWGSESERHLYRHRHRQPRQEQLLRVRRALRNRHLAARPAGALRQLLPVQQRLTQPFGFSFNKDLRGQGEARTIIRVSPHDIASVGVTVGREEVKNSFITDAGFTIVSARAQRSRGLCGEPVRNRRTVLSQRRRARRVLPHAVDSGRRLFAAVLSRRATSRA